MAGPPPARPIRRPLSTRRRFLFAAIVSVGSALLTLLAVEGALRLTGVGVAGRGRPWFAGGNHPRYLFEPSDGIGYRLRPGFEGEVVARTGEFRHRVSIDGVGNRDHDHLYPPGPKILAVGDSLTFGEGVDVEAAFPALLEERLGVRVVNAGVPGFRSPQMAARARELKDPGEPSLVLLTFDGAWDMDRCRNPFVYHEGFLVAESYRDRLRLIRGNLYAEETRRPWAGPASAWLQGRSNLGRIGVPVVFRWLRGGDEPPPVEIPPDWEGCVDEVALLAADLERDGSALFVVLAGGTSERGRALGRRAAERLERDRLDVFDLAPLLGDVDDPADPLVYPEDRHWNAAGHRRVAEILAPLVEDRLGR